MKIKSITCSHELEGKTLTVTIDCKDENGEGLSTGDAQLAAHLLSMQVDIASLEQGIASGNLVPEFGADRIRDVKTRYAILLKEYYAG